MNHPAAELCLKEQAASIRCSLIGVPPGLDRSRSESRLRELMSVALGDPRYQDDVVCWEFVLFGRWLEKAPVKELVRAVPDLPGLLGLLREYGGDLPELAVLSLRDWSGRDPDVVRSGAGWAARVFARDVESQRLCSLAHRNFSQESACHKLLVMRRPLPSPFFSD